MKEISSFKPFIGVGIILFGDEREVVRHKINSECTTYKENEFTENTTDYFPKTGVFIEYDINNRCNALIFNQGTSLNSEGTDLMKFKYSELRGIYDGRSSIKEVEEEIGITYLDLGFGVNKIFGKDEIQTLIVFSKNYWDIT